MSDDDSSNNELVEGMTDEEVMAKLNAAFGGLTMSK